MVLTLLMGHHKQLHVSVCDVSKGLCCQGQLENPSSRAFKTSMFDWAITHMSLDETLEGGPWISVVYISDTVCC